MYLNRAVPALQAECGGCEQFGNSKAFLNMKWLKLIWNIIRVMNPRYLVTLSILHHVTTLQPWFWAHNVLASRCVCPVIRANKSCLEQFHSGLRHHVRNFIGVLSRQVSSLLLWEHNGLVTENQECSPVCLDSSGMCENRVVYLQVGLC